MTKKELKTATNNSLIVDLATTYANLICNFNLNRGVIQHEKHLKDLMEEMLKRELLTQKDIDYLNQ